VARKRSRRRCSINTGGNTPVAFVNGEFLPLEQATVHIEDRGFQFADGVYEVIACFGGNFLDLKPHLERLKHSCDAVHISLPRPLYELEALVRELYARNSFSDAMIYIQITRGTAPRSHVINKAIEPTLVMTVRALPEPSERKTNKGLSAITLADFRWGRCDIKSTALLASVMGRYEAMAHGVDEAIWIDESGHVLEGCATNLFAVIDGSLVTHPLDHRILGGIMRDMVLRIAENEGMSLQQRCWSLNEPELSECMISSTTNAVLPLCTVDDRAVGNGMPGPVAALIRKRILAELDALRTG